MRVLSDAHHQRECWCGIDHSIEPISVEEASRRITHRVSVEAQTWGNTPPYPPQTMYRATCKCGWLGSWNSYRENVEIKCGADD